MGTTTINKVTLIAAIIGFAGLVISSIITGIYQCKIYNEQVVNQEIKDKTELLHKTYSLFGQMHTYKLLYEPLEAFTYASAPYNEKLNEINTANPEIGVYFSDILATLKLVEIYYDTDIQLGVKKCFLSEGEYYRNGEWWKLQNAELNLITEPMKKELTIFKKLHR